MPEKMLSVAAAKEFWRRYKKGKLAVVSLLMFMVIILIAVFAEYFAPFSPLKTLVGESFQSPAPPYLMGTDNLGRDILSGVIYGTRTSLLIASIALVTSAIIGVSVGSMAGYFGGLLDEILMRITDFFLTIPDLLLGIIVVSVFGATILNVALTIGVLTWSYIAKVARAEFLTTKQRTYVEAAVAAGENSMRIIFREILPNVAPSIIVMIVLNMARAILIEASLSFLGVGDANQASLGLMLYYAQRFPHVWWMIAFPGLMLFLTTLSTNVIGDGLNDALNPRLKER